MVNWSRRSLSAFDCVRRAGVCQSPNVYVRQRVENGVGVYSLHNLHHTDHICIHTQLTHC